ncbi:hypothetical protein [Onishia taeanensis]
MQQHPSSDAIVQAEKRSGRQGKRDAPIQHHHYRTYGLRLSSQFVLPELLPSPPVSVPDAEIVATQVPTELVAAEVSNGWMRYTKARCQFSAEGIARYRIDRGYRIQVDRREMSAAASRTSEEDLRLYLLGTALGTLLHQRHWLPLHLSAVNTPSGVWGFTGPSGAGKSTLAAWLHYHLEWPLVSDDVGVIKPSDSLPYLYPGPPRLKLWKSALTRLGLDHRHLVQDQARTAKYHLVNHTGFLDTARPLHHLVMLESATPDEPANLTPLEGLEAFQAVMATIYRPECGLAFNGHARLMAQAAGLARRIQVFRYRRPWSLDGMERSLVPLLERIHEGAGHGA